MEKHARLVCLVVFACIRVGPVAAAADFLSDPKAMCAFLASSGMKAQLEWSQPQAGGPYAAAFDGQRVLVTNFFGTTVALWKAADLTTIGSFVVASPGTPVGACSDGINFWIALSGTSQLARF